MLVSRSAAIDFDDRVGVEIDRRAPLVEQAGR